MNNSNLDNSSEVVEEWETAFHGISYLVTMIQSDLLLILEVEDEHGQRWSGEFTSQYIEEITQKAGNYKKYSMFNRMLANGFGKKSDSVFIDLLTFADLEVLKARKTGSSSHPTTSSSTSSTHSSSTSKRYVILTYTGEFDRVHYPLPLALEEVPNVAALQRTVRRLRAKLSHAPAVLGKEESDLKAMNTMLRKENTSLRHQLRHVPEPSSASSPTRASSAALPPPPHAQEMIKKLRREVEDLSHQLVRLSKQHDEDKREMERYRHMVLLGGNNSNSQYPAHGKNPSPAHRSNSPAQSNHSELSRYRERIKKLEQELYLERMSRGLPSTRPGSGMRSAHACPGTGARSRTPSPHSRGTKTSLYAQTASSASRRETPPRYTSSGARSSPGPRSGTPDSVSSRGSSRSRGSDHRDRDRDRGGRGASSTQQQQGKKKVAAPHTPKTPAHAHSTPKPSSRAAPSPSPQRERSPSNLRGARLPTGNPNSIPSVPTLPPRKAKPPLPPTVHIPSSASSVSAMSVESVRSVRSVHEFHEEVQQPIQPSKPAPQTKLAMASQAQASHAIRSAVPPSAPTSIPAPPAEESVADIDKRIQALQAYLDNARKGINS